VQEIKKRLEKVFVVLTFMAGIPAFITSVDILKGDMGMSIYWGLAVGVYYLLKTVQYVIWGRGFLPLAVYYAFPALDRD